MPARRGRTRHRSASRTPRANCADESARKSRSRREQFQQWTKHILARIELPIRRVLGDAGLKRPGRRRSDPGRRRHAHAGRDRTGSREHVRQGPPQRRLNPDEVVALGAAVQAGLIARQESVKDLVVTDVAPFTLGIEISKRIGPGAPRRLLPADHPPQHDHSRQPGRERLDLDAQPDRGRGQDLPGRKPPRRRQPVPGRVHGQGHPARPGRPGNRRPLHLRSQRRAGGRGDRAWRRGKRSRTSSPSTPAACRRIRCSAPSQAMRQAEDAPARGGGQSLPAPPRRAALSGTAHGRARTS